MQLGLPLSRRFPVDDTNATLNKCHLASAHKWVGGDQQAKSPAGIKMTEKIYTRLFYVDTRMHPSK